MYLYSDNDDLEQLQDQFVRLTALGVIFITGAHEEVFQLPAKCLIVLISPDPMTCCRCVKSMVVKTITMTVMLSAAAAVCGAVVNHRAGQAFSF